MPQEILQTSGDTVHLRIHGVLRKRDMDDIQELAKKLIREGKKPRLLAVIEDFDGWEKGVDWGDVSFVIEHGDDVAKIAFVGDPKWRDDAFTFVGKGLRATQIQYFEPDSLQEARAWLAQA